MIIRLKCFSCYSSDVNADNFEIIADHTQLLFKHEQGSQYPHVYIADGETAYYVNESIAEIAEKLESALEQDKYLIEIGVEHRPSPAPQNARRKHSDLTDF